MALYTWTTTQTEISASGSIFSTVTDLTVPSGHIFFLKSAVLEGNIEIGATQTGSLSFQISDSAGANFVTRTTRVDHAVDTNVNFFSFEFAHPKEEIVTSMPSNWGGLVTALLPTRGEESNLWNKQLGAGQILRFTPLDENGLGINGVGTLEITMSIRLSFLDFTI